jgi:HPt (histidine-containing phosphotransfer) domain-containing protein
MLRWVAWPANRLGPVELAAIDDLSAMYSGEQLVGVLRGLGDEMRAAVARLDEAAAAGDQVNVVRAAHDLRNTSRLVGATELTAAAAALDKPNTVIEASDRAQRVGVVHQVWDIVSAALDAEISRRAS